MDYRFRIRISIFNFALLLDALLTNLLENTIFRKTKLKQIELKRFGRQASPSTYQACHARMYHDCQAQMLLLLL